MSKPKVKPTKWLMHSDLAWIEPIVTPPQDYAEKTELFSKVIKGRSKIEAKTLLHLGCSAGGDDYTFKRHFNVVGVDISEGMLEIARKLNPEVAYLYGNMRSVRLKECFDAVFIPNDRFIFGEGEYLLRVLICAKPLSVDHKTKNRAYQTRLSII